MIDDSKPKLFGMESIDKTKRVYVVEGPIDSLFLSNCAAMAGSDADLTPLGDPRNVTVVYDNEPRNKEIVKKMHRAIDQGYRVCFWPEHIEQKDVNDMVNRAGLNGASIQAIIDQNTLSGLSAKMRLSTWSRA
jgi:hypothetical protein